MTRHFILVFGIIGVFCLGALGGLWTQAFLLPFISSHFAFQEWQFVQEWNDRVTVIKDVQEITITQEEAIVRVVENTHNSVVGIVSSKWAESIYGSGFIVTTDGFIITLADVVPQGYEALVYKDTASDALPAKVLKRDVEKNLVMLKIEERDLSTVGYALPESVEIGSFVVMVAKSVEAKELVTIVQAGSVRAKVASLIRTNMFDKQSLQGSPLFTLDGHIAGLSTIEADGRLVAIPSSQLREFSGL